MASYLKLAVHVGGDTAPAMAARLGVAVPTTHAAPGCTLAATGGAVRATGGGLLAVGGHPLGSPDDLDGIGDWREAARRFSDCDGAFYAVYWDGKARKLVMVSDFLGFQPLYLLQRPGELLLASETKAFRGTADLAAWGAFITLGFTIGDQTLMSGVRRVPPGAVTVYDAGAETLTTQPYWRWPAPAGAVAVDDLVDALRDSVRRYAGIGGDGTLLLSGGYDSRLLLFLLREAGLAPDAVIVSHRDEAFDADARLAVQVARQLGVRYRVSAPAADFFSTSAYLRYLADSDAGTPSLNLFIAQVSQFCRPPVMWEGLVPGCSLVTSHQPPGGFDAYMAREARGRESPIWRAAAKLFRPDVFGSMYESSEASRRREMARYSDDNDGMVEFIARNRARNRISINPLKVYANYAAVLCPGLTRDYFNLAGRIPYAARAHHALYHQLYARIFPAAMRIPFCSGGHVAGQPGSWRDRYERARAGLFAIGRTRPRLARRLGLAGLTRPMAPSTFADHAVLADEDEYLLPWDASAFAADPALHAAAERLLFHWRAWHWLHQGVLFDRLAPHALDAAGG